MTDVVCPDCETVHPVGDFLNPKLAEYCDDVMLDNLEREYERGELIHWNFVFELLNRYHFHLNAVTVERDRLKETLQSARDQRDRWMASARECEEDWTSDVQQADGQIAEVLRRARAAEAERDRLRAVVDAAIEVRRLRDASREVDEPANWDDENEVREMSRRLASATVATSDALDVLSDRLDQLDVGDVVGGSGNGT